MKSFLKANSYKLKAASGFTFIEILLVIALIIILAGLIIVAINPSKQLADARNSVRLANLNTIIEAVYQYSLDNKGALPGGINGTLKDICKTDALSCVGLVDLSGLTSHKKYLVSIPVEPLVTTGNSVGYKIMVSENRIRATAPYAEEGLVIELTR